MAATDAPVAMSESLAFGALGSLECEPGCPLCGDVATLSFTGFDSMRSLAPPQIIQTLEALNRHLSSSAEPTYAHQLSHRFLEGGGPTVLVRLLATITESEPTSAHMLLLILGALWRTSTTLRSNRGTNHGGEKECLDLLQQLRDAGAMELLATTCPQVTSGSAYLAFTILHSTTSCVRVLSRSLARFPGPGELKLAETQPLWLERLTTALVTEDLGDETLSYIMVLRAIGEASCSLAAHASKNPVALGRLASVPGLAVNLLRSTLVYPAQSLRAAHGAAAVAIMATVPFWLICGPPGIGLTPEERYWAALPGRRKRPSVHRVNPKVVVVLCTAWLDAKSTAAAACVCRSWWGIISGFTGTGKRVSIGPDPEEKCPTGLGAYNWAYRRVAMLASMSGFVRVLHLHVSSLLRRFRLTSMDPEAADVIDLIQVAKYVAKLVADVTWFRRLLQEQWESVGKHFTELVAEFLRVWYQADTSTEPHDQAWIKVLNHPNSTENTQVPEFGKQLWPTLAPDLRTSWLVCAENLRCIHAEVVPRELAVWFKAKRNANIKRLTQRAQRAFVKDRDWTNAAFSYTLLLQLARRQDSMFAAACLSNRCECFMKMKLPHYAVHDSTLGLWLEPERGRTKLAKRHGRASAAFGRMYPVPERRAVTKAFQRLGWVIPEILLPFGTKPRLPSSAGSKGAGAIWPAAKGGTGAGAGAGAGAGGGAAARATPSTAATAGVAAGAAASAAALVPASSGLCGDFSPASGARTLIGPGGVRVDVTTCAHTGWQKHMNPCRLIDDPQYRTPFVPCSAEPVAWNPNPFRTSPMAATVAYSIVACRAGGLTVRDVAAYATGRDAAQAAAPAGATADAATAEALAAGAGAAAETNSVDGAGAGAGTPSGAGAEGAPGAVSAISSAL